MDYAVGVGIISRNNRRQWKSRMPALLKNQQVRHGKARLFSTITRRRALNSLTHAKTEEDIVADSGAKLATIPLIFICG